MKGCAFALLIASAAWAQVAAEANAHYRTRQGREALARGLSRPGRDAVIREVRAAGFRLASSREHVPGSQYLLIFAK